jgi:hypothetical protein
MNGMPQCICLNASASIQISGAGNEIPIRELACIELVVTFRRTRDPVRLNTGNAGMSALLHIIKPLSLTLDLCYNLRRVPEEPYIRKLAINEQLIRLLISKFLRVVPDMEQLTLVGLGIIDQLPFIPTQHERRLVVHHSEVFGEYLIRPVLPFALKQRQETSSGSFR